MAHTLEYNSAMQIIKVSFNESVSLGEVKETVKMVFQLTREHNCFKVFTDLRHVEVTLSTFSIYELPKLFLETAHSYGISVYKFKRATVIPADAEYAHFFETVMINRGQYLKLFTDAEQAEKWLLQG